MRAVVCPPGEALGLLAPIRGRRTDAQGRFDLADLIARGAAYKIVDGAGVVLGAYVLDANWPLLWITAGAGRADVDMTAVIDALVTAQGGGFAEVGFRTERPGLVRKARRLGYQVTSRDGPAYFLRKSLT